MIKYQKFIIIISLISIFFLKDNNKVMYFFSNNFGDNLNYFLLNDMTNKNLEYYDVTINRQQNQFDFYLVKKLDELSKINLLFIGSILDIISNWTYIFNNDDNKYKTIISKLFYKIYDFFNPLIIFGTGFISYQKYESESYFRNINVIAVRGNETLHRLKRNGIKIKKDVILADPAILAPMLLNISEINNMNFNKKYNLCIIPHFIDANNPFIKTKIFINNSIILNINENPYKLINDISKCKNVLSSGLHGLIISDSLGIPNMRMIVSDLIIGGDYKFIDYYSSYGLELPFKIDLRNTTFSEKELNSLSSNYLITREKIREKQCQLLSKFPLKLNSKYDYFKKYVCSYN